MSFGEYMNAGGFIQKTVPGTTVIHSKQSNWHQEEIWLVKPMKNNSRRRPEPSTRGGAPITETGWSAPPVGWSAYGLGRPAHFRGRLAQASAWCLLEPSRVVFHSFHGLNHLLSSVCLFRVYDSGPKSYFLYKSSCNHEITKAHGIY